MYTKLIFLFNNLFPEVLNDFPLGCFVLELTACNSHLHISNIQSCPLTKVSYFSLFKPFGSQTANSLAQSLGLFSCKCFTIRLAVAFCFGVHLAHEVLRASGTASAKETKQWKRFQHELQIQQHSISLHKRRPSHQLRRGVER